MIPKIIHYCWFGRNPKPQKVLDYLKRWKEICPGYEIKEWNEDNFDINMMPFTKEAYRVKKYAFVSDVCRLYALQKYGGIYLDTDVRLLKTFDSYLAYHSFIGKEVPFKVGTAVIGAEASCMWLGAFLQTYQNKHFISRRGVLNDLENTAILTKLLNQLYPDYKNELEIFDIDIFCGKLYAKKQYVITERTVAVHEFSGTWIKRKLTIANRIKNIFHRFII